MATSGVAYGKLIVAAEEGRRSRSTGPVDARRRSRPATPRAGLDGALLPAAGPKGFGLAYMIDMLAAMGGARGQPGRRIRSTATGRSRRELGFAMLAIDPEALEGALFAARVRRLAEAVRAAGRSGAATPMIPGEPESRFAADHAGSAAAARHPPRARRARASATACRSRSS